jgi:hypothetical protein
MQQLSLDVSSTWTFRQATRYLTTLPICVQVNSEYLLDLIGNEVMKRAENSTGNLFINTYNVRVEIFQRGLFKTLYRIFFASSVRFYGRRSKILFKPFDEPLSSSEPSCDKLYERFDKLPYLSGTFLTEFRPGRRCERALQRVGGDGSLAGAADRPQRQRPL